MNKTLVLAEKPSVGRDLARVLNCHKKGNGCFEGDKDKCDKIPMAIQKNKIRYASCRELKEQVLQGNNLTKVTKNCLHI